MHIIARYAPIYNRFVQYLDTGNQIVVQYAPIMQTGVIEVIEKSVATMGPAGGNQGVGEHYKPSF